MEINIPASTTPNCIQVLRYLDSFIDNFNKESDHRLLCFRVPIYCKDYKYEVEDMDELLFIFYRLCEEIRLDPLKTEIYRNVLNQEISVQLADDLADEDQERWKAYRRNINDALKCDTPLAMQKLRAISGNQLWLRAALVVEPGLPAPWPVWPMALHLALRLADQNFRGGSENWTRSMHESGTWASRTMLEDMERLGWYHRSTAAWPLEPKLAGEIEAARRMTLERVGIFVV